MMDEAKRSRISNKPEIVKGEDDIDRISKLPDGILTNNILSLLNSKEAVQTCVLSKRWCKLWAFVPCIRFSFYISRETSETVERDRKVFENFVSSFLRLRDDATDLHHFSIQFSSFDRKGKLSGCTASTWVLYAAKHNPKKLDINLSGHDQIHLPDCLFTCKSLEDVCLNFETREKNRLEIKADKVCLPNLTDLELTHAFINGDSMEKILFGCPILENLSMSKCTLKMNSISFQTVKSLDMHDCHFGDELNPSTYSISAPRVEYLSFNAQIWTGAKLQDMPMLSYAYVSLRDEDGCSAYDLELLSGLSGVENLEIDSDYIEEMLEAELPRCSTFYNLKKLRLGFMCMCCHFSFVSSFLELCPNLEDLTLSHTEAKCVNGHRIQEEQGSFGCSRLRKIYVRYTNAGVVDRLVGLLLEGTVGISNVKITLDKCFF